MSHEWQFPKKTRGPAKPKEKPSHEQYLTIRHTQLEEVGRKGPGFYKTQFEYYGEYQN